MELKEKKIIIATHVYTTGPSQDLREFLNAEKTGRLLFLGHPIFYHERLEGSGYELYGNGNLLKKKYGRLRKIPFAIYWLWHLVLNIYWSWTKGKHWDLFIGFDNLNALSGIILRRFGKVDKAIYYVIDYNPKRFTNKLVNRFYHAIDRFCVRHCDETWNLSPRMEEGRQKYFGFSGGRQVVVPIGVWTERIKTRGFEEIEKNTLVFMGHVLQQQGIQHVIDAMPLIIEKIPGFKFLVIGAGEYMEPLKQQANRLGVADKVVFTGYVEKHEDIEEMMSKCAVAVAMYEKYDKNGNLSFTYFADPGKIKSYLATGLTILLTDIAYNSGEIEKRRCGFVITQEREKIADAVINLMKDEDKLKEYRSNALSYAKEFNWNVIFKDNLERIISLTDRRQGV